MLSLSARARLTPTNFAVISDGSILTYQMLHEHCTKLICALHLAGDNQGQATARNAPQVFAFEANTDLDTLVLIFALLEANVTALPLNPRLTAEEREYLVELAGARVLSRTALGWSVAQTSHLKARGDAIGASPAPTSHLEARGDAIGASPTKTSPHDARGDAIGDSSAATRSALRTASSAATSQPTVLIATSGSTGTSKLVQLSRQALTASARASAQHLAMSASDRALLSLNPSHIGGYSILMRSLESGAAVVLAHAGFDLENLCHWVEREQITLLSLVPTQLQRLLALPDRRPLTSLRAVLIGGAACSPAILAAARRAGIPALATYGMSEAASQVTTQPLADVVELNPGEDSGVPVGQTELRIVDGVLEIRGPTLFDGYVSPLSSSACASAVDSEGWFSTGDLGVLTRDGRFEYHGRRMDRIVTGGENVSPLEVERHLLSLPGVTAAVVVGVPDSEWGQVVAAAVERNADQGNAEAAWFSQLEAALRRHLAPFKCPKRWQCLPALPRLATGKVDRLAVIRSFSSK